MTPQTVSDMAEKNSQGAIGNAAIPQASDTAEGNSQGATGNVATLQTASDMAEEIKSTLSDKEWKKVSEKKHQCESQDEEINKILPPVHSSSQSQLQTTIFLQQLKRRYTG